MISRVAPLAVLRLPVFDVGWPHVQVPAFTLMVPELFNVVPGLANNEPATEKLIVPWFVTAW